MPKWTEEQQRAIEADNTNIIVSAGAGSGKTAVLTARVLRKLKQGIPVSKLLILTFTTAAANEMKERIRKNIKKDISLTGQLPLLDSAYITTFDSYTLSIVKRYHYLLNISPNVSIINSNIIAMEKEKILDQIFEKLYKEKNLLFEELIGQFCIKDDIEIRKYILNISEQLNMKVDREDYLKKYIETYFNDNYINNRVNEYLELLNSLLDLLNDQVLTLSSLVDTNYQSKLIEVLAPLLNSSNYEEIKCNSIIKLPNLPKDSEEGAIVAKTNLSNTIKKINNMCAYQTVDEIKETIFLTKNHTEIICKILKLYFEKLDKFKYDNDSFEFVDIAIMAIKIVKDNEEIRNELKNYFNEIMVDEYQDTNDLQEAFVNLISSNNVYMVGDVKQSIYRFRNANPYIFKNKYDSYKGQCNGIKIDLNKNFRSRNEVVSGINTIFNQIMDDKIGGANYLEDHQMVAGNNAYSESGNIDQNHGISIFKYQYDSHVNYSKEEIEAFVVANDIKQKINKKYKVFDKETLALRDIKYSDIVILMDRATNFDLYKKIFEYMQIPLSIKKDEILTMQYDSIVISNLLSLIKKISLKEYDKNFEYLFTSVARSFLFEYSDQDIFDIFKNNNFYHTDIFEKCSNISDMLNYSTPEEILWKTIKSFNIFENITKLNNIDGIIKRIDYLISLSQDSQRLNYDCNMFIDYLQELISNNYDIKYSLVEDDNESVKLMTIHKSKGLEYPICYYTGLYKSFNIRDLNDKITYDNKYGIIVPFFKDGIGQTIYKTLLKEHYNKEEISEKIRLFYVALTRSREKIIMVLPNTNNNSVISDNTRLNYKSFGDIINSLSYYLDQYNIEIDINDYNITSDYDIIKSNNLDSYLKDNIKPINVSENNFIEETFENKRFSKNTNQLITKEQQKNIDMGIEIHAILEHLDFNDLDLSTIKNNLYRRKVESLINQPVFKNIKDAKIFQEYEFIYMDKNDQYHGIIDLMLEYDDHIDIIDYKLKTITDEAYIKQLKGYSNYIKIVSKKNVKTYLYSIIDEKIISI